MAIDGTQSTFTSENNYTLDTFKEMFELSVSEVTAVQRWKELKAKQNKTTEENTELQNLTTQLTSKIITSADWNLLLHAMYNLEQAYKDKGLDQIENTVNDYIVKEYGTAISKQIETIIVGDGETEGKIAIDAVKIIISETTPSEFVEGALWIKPKTTT